jgi:hypothetical protein
MRYLKLFESFSDRISENLQYHIDNNKPIVENIFRPGSKKYFDLIKEARELYDNHQIELSELDTELFESTDIGKFSEYDGKMVPLDLPMETIQEVNEAEYKGKEVELNKPMRSSGPKKYKVYVKNPKTGKVICVNFGDVKGGLTAKVNNPEARKSFSKRMDCKNKTDKTKAGYWSCRLPRYGLVNTTYKGYW